MGAAVTLGRYTLHDELSSGGMATVHLGRLVGPVGFGRTVAIKRLHPQYAKDPEFVRMFLDEAHLAARIQHPNVVHTLDVVAEGGELFLVLELVKGESLSTLSRALSLRSEKMPVSVASSVIIGALSGLAAAHDARDARGEPLQLVHRDVSPQNVMVGADGVARVLDFGVAKARARVSNTQEGHLKGKIAYMAPEQLSGETSPRSDLYSAAVVLWELLAGRRLFVADSEVQLIAMVQRGPLLAPSEFRAEVPPELDRICARALAHRPEDRYESAVAMARDIDRSVDVASAMRVSEWMADIAGPMLDARSKLVTEMESGVRDVGSLDELSRTPLEEAATKAVATVSSIAKAADQAVRDGRRKATQAARDLAATNPMLRAALAAVGKPKKPEPEPDPEPPEDQTRAAKPKKT